MAAPDFNQQGSGRGGELWQVALMVDSLETRLLGQLERQPTFLSAGRAGVLS
jgi:hypothetical protein